MSFLVPAALGLAALAGPLIALYMLRSKRRPREVASTLLWQQMGEPVSSAVPWKPLRLTPLLLIQLAVLALFVLSLARPFFTERTVLGPHTVFVVDTSGSMAMGERFPNAISAALGLAAQVSTANLVSVVDAGPAPRVALALSQDRERVEEVLASLQPSGGAEDLSTAIRLARGLAAPDRQTSVVVLSDGGTASLPEEPVVGATHLRFEDAAPNLSIAAFDAQASAEGAIRAFVEVENHTAETRGLRVSLTIDELPAGFLDLEVPALATAGEVVPLDAVPGTLVSAELVDVDDGLALDDRADLVVGGGPARTVGVTGTGSPFLTALLGSASGFTSASDPEEADILVVDGGALPDIDRPTWLIRPEQVPEGLELAGIARNLAVTFQRPGDPVLDGVDLSEVAVAESQVVEGLDWLALVSSGDVALFLLGEVDGHRVVYTTFDLTHSNLPVQMAFPILGVRLLDWLAGAEAGSASTAPAGEPIALVAPEGSHPVVGVPDGTSRELAADATAFLDTGIPGVYQVSYLDEAGVSSPGEVAVRRFVPAESSGPTRQIATVAGPGGEAEEGRLIREWAPWVLGAAIVLLAIEWWVGHQRPGLAARPPTAAPRHRAGARP